jgi:hypothetical protein
VAGCWIAGHGLMLAEGERSFVRPVALLTEPVALLTEPVALLTEPVALRRGDERAKLFVRD